MPFTRKHAKPPKPDARGRRRVYIGHDPSGKKQRFQVGDRSTSEQEAARRIEAIRQFYECLCERAAIQAREHDMPFSPRWSRWAMQLAKRIGEDGIISDADLAWYSIDNRAGIIELLRSWGVRIVVNEPQQLAEGFEAWRDRIGSIVSEIVQKEMAHAESVHGPVVRQASVGLTSPLEMDDSPLYSAVAKYKLHVLEDADRDENGDIKPWSHKRCELIDSFKGATKNFPLWRFNFLECQRIAAYWRNRPNTHKGERCGKTHAKHVADEIKRFCKWLHKHPEYRWKKPDGFEEIDWKPVSLEQDQSDTVWQTESVPTYTGEQLALIAQETDQFGRAMIALCVNCAFGASEVGQWPTKKYIFNQPHPKPEIIGYETHEEESWVVGERPKTKEFGNYGEHLLWSRVADAVKPFVLDGRDVLPVTRLQTRWYKGTKNKQSKFRNWWQPLVEKAHDKHPEKMPNETLPFGSLRDTLPNLLRQKYSDEIASLALQHQTLGEDQLLRCYANFPFARLFRATAKLEKHFEPLLRLL